MYVCMHKCFFVVAVFVEGMGWKIHFAIWLMRTCKRAIDSGAVAIQVDVKNAITPNIQIIWGKI